MSSSVPVKSQPLQNILHEESDLDHPKDSGMQLSRSVPVSGNLIENSEKKLIPKFYIRLRKKDKSSGSIVSEESKKEMLSNKDLEKEVSVENLDFVDNVEPKKWNLRTRKPLVKPCNGYNGGKQETTVQTEVKKEKKIQFSPILTRKEIENDLFLMTGRKPATKPMKRPMNIQQDIDNLFPGLCLPTSVKASSYEVHDPDIEG